MKAPYVPNITTKDMHTRGSTNSSQRENELGNLLISSNICINAYIVYHFHIFLKFHRLKSTLHRPFSFMSIFIIQRWIPFTFVHHAEKATSQHYGLST